MLLLFFFLSLATRGLSKKEKPFIQTSEIVDYFHVPPTSFDGLGSHLRETGLWRSKWFAYRDFYKDPDSPEDEFGKRDRLCIRFNPDRTIRVYSKAKRPLVQMGKKFLCGLGYGSEVQRDLDATKTIPRPKFKSRKGRGQGNEEDVRGKFLERLQRRDSELKAQIGDPEARARRDRIRKQLEIARLYDVDGRYGTEVDPNNFHRIKMDVYELDEDGEEEKVRHEISFEFGDNDAISQRFVLGRVYRNPSRKDKTRRLGTYLVGITSLMANPHRPVLDRDFQAFQ